jgi:hypothetical protein
MLYIAMEWSLPMLRLCWSISRTLGIDPSIPFKHGIWHFGPSPVLKGGMF